MGVAELQKHNHKENIAEDYRTAVILLLDKSIGSASSSLRR